jgi:4-amino-4-deoxy-L-arabinose transferase-like glycosyltransferase
MKKTETTIFPSFSEIREGWIILILLALAFGVRLYLVYHTYLITNDGILYVKMSRLISQGEAGSAFSLLFFNLYPFIIVIFQRVFNDWEFSAQMVSAVFGSLTIIPFYFLIRSLFGRTTALISSILFLFHPYLVRYSAEVIRGPTFWFFFMMTLWVGWEAISRKRAWLFFLTSLSGAVSFLLRPEGIFVVPIVAVWVFLNNWGTFKSTYRQSIFFVLILLFTIPILLSPGMLYLKQKTGRWHWARADTIVRIATARAPMSDIKKNFHKLEMKPWDDSSQGQDEFIRLRQFLSLATEHRIGIVTLEMMGKFQKTMHPLLLILLLFGAIRRKEIQYQGKEELFLFSVLAFFFLILIGYGTITFYIGTRHMIALVTLCLAWAGIGVFELEYRIRHTNWLAKSSQKCGAGFRNMRWILLILIVLALLPKTLAPQRVEKVPIKEAGIWIKEHGARNPVVMTQGRLVRIAFYADGTFLEVPKDQDLFEYAKKNRVNFLAINEKDIERSHPNLIHSLDSEQFREEVVIGKSSGSYVIRIYSVRS